MVVLMGLTCQCMRSVHSDSQPIPTDTIWEKIGATMDGMVTLATCDEDLSKAHIDNMEGYVNHEYERIVKFAEKYDPNLTSPNVTIRLVWALYADKQYEKADSILAEIPNDFFDFYSPLNTALVRLKVKAQIALSAGDKELSDKYVKDMLSLAGNYLQAHKAEIDDYINTHTTINRIMADEANYWIIAQYYCFYSVLYGKDETYRKLDELLAEHPCANVLVDRIKSGCDNYSLLGNSPL